MEAKTFCTAIQRETGGRLLKIHESLARTHLYFKVSEQYPFHYIPVLLKATESFFKKIQEP